MIGIDTNVLVRFIVQDDSAQAAIAEALIAKQEELFVPQIVACEIVWVLSVSYEFQRAEIASAMRQLLHARQLRFETRDLLVRALDAYTAGKGDFADYVIREQALAAGCTAVVTFDRALQKEPAFHAP